jgi:mannose-1-phosphate guanylyltransferase
MAITALLLSAGHGTRLRPYTNDLPKPAIPFLGLPLCYYSLAFLKKFGCKNIVMNLHHLPQKIEVLTKNPELADFTFQFSRENEKAMGSGGALYYAQSFLQKTEAFFAINSDEVMIPDTPNILEKLQTHFQKTKALATLLVTDHPDLQKTLRPVWINPEGVIRGFGDKPTTHETLRPVHYTGYKIFSKDVLPLLPSGESHIFHDTLVPAMKAGALVNTVFEKCLWWETGSWPGLLTACHDSIKLIHQSPQNNHFRQVYETFGLPFELETSCQAGSTIAVHKKATFNPQLGSGTVLVDANSKVAHGVRLHNVIIDKNLNVSSALHEQMLLHLEGNI